MLTLAEQGAYFTILVEIYRAERPVRYSLAQWGRVMGCSKARAHEHIETLIAAGKIYRDDLGAIGNDRALAELKAVETSKLIKATARSLRLPFRRH